VAELRRLPWPLVWIAGAPLATQRWRHFLEALNAAELRHLTKPRFQIGTVEIDQQLHRNWELYEAAWSGNHRRHMRKALHRAVDAGGVELEVCSPKSAHELQQKLREGFEVEHNNWKGAAGTSVLADSAAWDFYLRQAAELAVAGELDLSFLRHKGRAIAFEYGWNSRGKYYTPKVGYDDTFAKFSPGQLLRYFVLQQAFHRRDRRTVDFLGPLSEATAKWSTSTYCISKLAIATGTRGRGLLWAYRNLFKPLKNKIRPTNDSSTQSDDDDLKIVQLQPQKREPLSLESVET
jgi:CelD/BcsL family acetyltransferase involved in cellulose biosynthesis